MAMQRDGILDELHQGWARRAYRAWFEQNSGVPAAGLKFWRSGVATGITKPS